MMGLKKAIPLHASLLLAVALGGCASNDKDEFGVAIVPPQLKSQAAREASSVSVTFRQDNGRIVSETVEAEGRYTGSQDASTSEVRAKAIEAMITSASDKVNGQLISNSIRIRQQQYGSGELEETKRDVVSQTVGLGKLLSDPDCRRADSRGLEITMICTGKVAVPLVDSVTVERENFDG